MHAYKGRIISRAERKESQRYGRKPTTLEDYAYKSGNWGISPEHILKLISTLEDRKNYDAMSREPAPQDSIEHFHYDPYRVNAPFYLMTGKPVSRRTMSFVRNFGYILKPTTKKEFIQHHALIDVSCVWENSEKRYLTPSPSPNK
ncbi:MAG: hypothetical protein AABY22_22900 [Nanoarchaeota archaeon]